MAERLGIPKKMPFAGINEASAEPMAGWFYEHSSDGFAISKGGAILRTNQSWCDLLGITRGKAVGQTATDIISEGDLPAFYASEVELRERGETKFEVRLKTTRQTEVWVDVSVKRGADGYALIAVQDISGERELAEEQERLANLAGLLRAHAGALMWQYSPLDELFLVEATRQPGTTLLEPVSREVPLSNMLQRLDSDDARDAFLRNLHNSVETGEPGQVEFRNVADDGRKESHRSFWRGLRKQVGGRWRLIGLTQDVTDLMEARDAALLGQQVATEAERVKSRFLANISHEFRTPMNGVLGVLRLLKNHSPGAPANSLLDEGIASAEMLNAILQDLIDLSDTEAGMLAVSLGAVDAARMAQDVIALFQPELDAKRLIVRSNITSDSLFVITDALRLKQILASLIGNAAKFTLSGGVTIRLITLGDGDDHRVRFEVDDTGIGIAPETMAELFSTFRQADDTATRRFGGIGHGLALARRLARLLGGEVGGSSELGRGSTFWVEVPAPLAAQITAPEDEAPFKGLRVLVVDDNATNLLVATKILDIWGATVETADDGVKAVEAVQAAHFDLVLMDIQMPNMDGVEATSRIRALPAPVGQVAIVALTANTSAAQIESYKAVGMDGIVSKPVSASALFNAIIQLSTGHQNESVYRLTYHSRVCAGIISDLESVMSDILTTATRFNGLNDITGALLACDGWFVQTLEGPQEAVDQLYARIEADPRHYDVTLMGAAMTERRQLGEWNMIGLSRNVRGIANFLRGIDFDPSTLDEGEAVTLLSSIVAVEKSESARLPVVENASGRSMSR